MTSSTATAVIMKDPDHPGRWRADIRFPGGKVWPRWRYAYRSKKRLVESLKGLPLISEVVFQ